MALISPTDLLIARLQAQLGAVSQKAATARKKIGTSSRQDETTQTPAHTLADNSQRLLDARISSIEPDDPERSQKIFRAFLEVTLLTEFGSKMINDPAFYQMIDNVYKAMIDDALICQHVTQAAEMLDPLK